jgi:hypothetical protein
MMPPPLVLLQVPLHPRKRPAPAAPTALLEDDDTDMLSQDVEVERAGVCQRLRLLFVWLLLSSGNLKHMLVGGAAASVTHVGRALDLLGEADAKVAAEDRWCGLSVVLVERAIVAAAAANAAAASAAAAGMPQ